MKLGPVVLVLVITTTLSTANKGLNANYIKQLMWPIGLWLEKCTLHIWIAKYEHF